MNLLHLHILRFNFPSDRAQLPEGNTGGGFGSPAARENSHPTTETGGVVSLTAVASTPLGRRAPRLLFGITPLGWIFVASAFFEFLICVAVANFFCK